MNGSDPIRSATGVCAFVGAMNLLLGLLLGSLGVVPELASLMAVEGLLYLALAWGIWRESRACAYLAAALYTMASLNLLRVGLLPAGLLIRALITIQLWRAAFRIEDLKDLDRVAEQRRRALAEGGGVFTAPPVAVARAVEPRRSSSRVAVMAAPYRRVCLRCDREFPVRTLRCADCRVQLFDA